MVVWIPRCCSPPPCNSPTRGRSSTCRSETRPVASESCASRSGTVPAPGSIAPRRNTGRSHARFTTRRNARGAIWTSSSTRPTSTRSCRAWPARPMASGRFRCRGRGRAVGSRSPVRGHGRRARQDAAGGGRRGAGRRARHEAVAVHSPLRGRGQALRGLHGRGGHRHRRDQPQRPQVHHLWPPT